MQFSPSFNESLLPPWESARYQFDLINGINRHVILIVGMKMRPMMRCVCLPVHANNDTEESTEFRHEAMLLSNLQRRKEVRPRSPLYSDMNSLTRLQ